MAQHTKDVQIQTTGMKNDCLMAKHQNKEDEATLITQENRVEILTQKKVAVLKDVHLLG
jgi:hypothetical protein